MKQIAKKKANEERKRLESEVSIVQNCKSLYFIFFCKKSRAYNWI